MMHAYAYHHHHTHIHAYVRGQAIATATGDVLHAKPDMISQPIHHIFSFGLPTQVVCVFVHVPCGVHIVMLLPVIFIGMSFPLVAHASCATSSVA